MTLKKLITPVTGPINQISKSEIHHFAFFHLFYYAYFRLGKKRLNIPKLTRTVLSLNTPFSILTLDWT